MPQVSEFDPITVFGDAPRSRRSAATLPSPGGNAAAATAERDPFASSPGSLAARLRDVVWWRVALGIIVIAVWLAAAVNASAASITLSTSATKNAKGGWDVELNYAVLDVNSGALQLLVNGKIADSLPRASKRVTLREYGDGDYTMVLRSTGANTVQSNSVALKLSSAGPVLSAKKVDAARLLMQASFGPRSVADIDAVDAQGLAAWIDSQFGKPFTPHNTYLDRIKAAGEEVKEEHVFESIWQQLIWGDARLRARVALALSEIMVISNIAPDQKNEAMVTWMDMLYRNAFANYRTLLQEVTLHPAMGYYLNMLGNDKEDLATGRMPNENYAREVLQLFSIGLNELNVDGSIKRDAAGKAIASYDQPTVQGFAAAFTGWNFSGNDVAKSDSFYNPKEEWTQFMRAWPSRHSSGPKKLLGNTVLPPGQTPERDLSDALDNIATHPNVAPFMSKRLIQFLVTSNPSPAYISRISGVWNNNGQGVRGDMKAVIRAILLDSEARSVDLNSTSYGKVREPMVKFIHFINVMQGQSKNGRNSIWWLESPDDYLGQSPLLAPSVFNFFSPAFTKPGSIAQAGLVVPEMQMVTDTQIVGSTNFFTRMINDHGVGFNDTHAVNFDTAQWEAIADDANALLDRINWVWFAGAMSVETRNVISRALAKLNTNEKHERMELAFKLAVIAPEFSVQR
jgi:uncharacterized protein (DUF1800 family)